MVDAAKQHVPAFCRHIVRDSLRSRLGSIGRGAVRASVRPAAFTHISFAIAHVSAKEQQELAMCWRWDHISKTHGSVIGSRTEGSKGFGHGSSVMAGGDVKTAIQRLLRKGFHVGIQRLLAQDFRVSDSGAGPQPPKPEAQGF